MTETLTPPRVFVGMRAELMNLCHQNGWNPHKIYLINCVESAYRLRGIRVTKDEVYYGETIKFFTPGTMFHISEQLQYLIRKVKIDEKDRSSRETA